MRKPILGKLLLSVGIVVAFASCKDDNYLTTAAPPPDVSFVEEFDTMTAAYNRGWRYINVSEPKNTDGFWTQGGFHNPYIWDGIYMDFAGATILPKPIPFGPYSSKGSYSGFIGATFMSVDAIDVLSNGDIGTISNWVVSPITLMKNGDKIVFYTRNIMLPLNGLGGGDSTDYANRLQVRFTPTESLNVGAGADPGDFNNALLDINPTYKLAHTLTSVPDAYPKSWTRFEATLAGINGAVKGRFAFRFYNDQWGNFLPSGDVIAGTGVALDSVAFISAK
jgi:hypothetical protein